MYKSLFCFSVCIFLTACSPKSGNHEMAMAFDAEATRVQMEIWKNTPGEEYDLTPCVALMDSAIKYNPRHAYFYAKKAQFYWEMGLDSLAVPSMWTAVSLNPDFVEAKTGLGMMYRRLGCTDSAEYYFRDALAGYLELSRDEIGDDYNVRVNGGSLVYFLTGDADSARRFVYQELDTAAYQKEGLWNLLEMITDYSSLDSILPLK